MFYFLTMSNFNLFHLLTLSYRNATELREKGLGLVKINTYVVLV